MKQHTTSLFTKLSIPIVVVLIVPLIMTIWLGFELRKLEHLDRARSFANEVEEGIYWIVNNKGIWSTNAKAGIYATKCGENFNFTFLDPHNPFPTKSKDYRFLSLSSKVNGGFEEEALKELNSGKSEYWQIKDGVFWYAKIIKTNAACLNCHGNRNEIKEPFLTIVSETCGSSCFGYRENEPKGVIVVKQELISPIKILSHVKWQFIVAQVIILISIILLFYIIKKYITGPITEIAEKAIDIAYGNLDVEFKPADVDEKEVKDEITKLEIALDLMKKNMKEAIERLRKK